MKPNFRSLAPILLGIAVGCGGEQTPPADGAGPVGVLQIETLVTPLPAAAEEPWLHATGSSLLVSWQESLDDGGALRFTRLEAETGQWEPARTIYTGADLLVNWADFPALAATPGGRLAAHWMRRNGPNWYDYDIWMAISSDGGETWPEPFKLHRDDVSAEHGFVSLVPDPTEGLVAVWLDGRETASAGDEGEARGAMTLRATRVSEDGSRGEEHLLDGRICDCCQTDAVRHGNEVVAVYRDRSADEVRDIYVVRGGPDGWSEPAPVADDGWQIPGCPVNGPAIASHDDRLAVAWFTLGHGAPEVRLAYSHDGGRSFDVPQVVESGGSAAATLGRVDAAWVGSRLVVVWLTDVDGQGEVRYAAFDLDGNETERGVLGITSPARSSGFPRMAASGDRGWVAWRVPGDDSHVEMRSLSLAGS